MNEQAAPMKKKFYKRAWFWVIIVFLALFIIIGESGSREQKRNTNNTENQQNYVYDIPSLIGKNLGEVREALGTPQFDDEPNAAQLQLGTTEWNKTYEKDGNSLLVTYKVSDQSIIDFFISTNDPSGATKDTKQLLRVGNLSENDPTYKVEFIKALTDKSSYTGVKITPTN